jgi:hypothetical protein
MRTPFINPDKLGAHGYGFGLTEKNGVIYTKRGGHLDTGHLRIAADWTAYLSKKVNRHLLKGDDRFSFKFSIEPSVYHIKLVYPANWKTMPQAQREQISRKISIRLGQYLAYTATTWHEIITWFGYRSVGVLPQFHSAFTWEDLYSNLLGTHLAVKALEQSEYKFNKAMTLGLARELKILEAQPKKIAREATEKLRGKWFGGNLFIPDIRKRNFDTGVDDGFVTPTLLPSLGKCEPISYPVPTLDFLADYGFDVDFQIDPKVWEKKSILNVIYTKKSGANKRIEPVAHFGTLVEYMKMVAEIKYGFDISEEPKVKVSKTGPLEP